MAFKQIVSGTGTVTIIRYYSNGSSEKVRLLTRHQKKFKTGIYKRLASDTSAKYCKTRMIFTKNVTVTTRQQNTYPNLRKVKIQQ